MTWRQVLTFPLAHLFLVFSDPSVTPLSLSNVGISFGATELLRNITFTVAEGERWGIIGRNGAGKTSIFNVVTGDLQPTVGSAASKPGLRHALLDRHRAFEGATTVWQAGAAAWREVMLLEQRIAEQAVRVALTQPVKVYARNRGDLSRVTDNAFVGITSVSQPDGTQRATEIHVFPEDLRGLGEGSRPMGAAAGGANRSTMTNGSVSGLRMTNGSARMTNGAARMTNGTSRGAAGGTVTVTYNGGSQTITVPPDVPVTVIEATSEKLAPGASVVVSAARGPDGTITSSRLILSATTQPRR